MTAAWLITPAGGRLHHVTVPGDAVPAFTGPLVAACGRTLYGLSVPGQFTSRAAERCAVCVRAGRDAVIDRFWKRVQVGEPDECWPWVGELNNQGYARFVVSYEPKRTRVLGHRFSYALASDEDIDGRVVMHTCDNPPCVNPAHLRLGTQLDNIRDCLAKGRMNTDGLALGHTRTAR